MKAKTRQQGYYLLKPADKWCHFSMNCWINLKQDSGNDIGTLAKQFEDSDELTQFTLLADIIYAGLKANDQEEGNDIDYNVFNVRNWVNELNAEDSQEFMDALTHSMNKPLGKKEAKK